ncbi:bile acid:Na+ symporter, BASS family [Singulisphaera sp. GP187]|uniref:bile acid:sodium symporter family protein n=1 Tax=Singulisphaera sp. GP187 TaxID=1882752 RepID=UPI00092AD471|nr:bile acid:sodium symporter [Singulisphaera sp. GP187]SIO23397.1 bile acid:Na+ symporter, BASS family [Singulisphaera sp. GP187]
MGDALIKLLNVIALMAMMLSIGLTVKYEQVVASIRQTRLVALALLANFVLIPLITVGLLAGFQAQPLVSAGFLILAVCPGAPVGPPLAAIAKGNVAVATGLMVILAALSAVLSPALLSILLARISPEGNLHADYLAIVQSLLITQLLPLGLGLAIHHWAPWFTRGVVKPIGILANVLLLGLVGLIVAVQHETLAAIRFRGWAGMILLLLASLGIGWGCGGRDLSNRKALATTTATRNLAVGLVIAGGNFAGTPAVTAVVAYGLVSIVGALGCALLLGRYVAIEPKNAHIRP